MATNKEEPKNQLNPFIKYIGLGTQMGVVIYFGNLLGVWLDEKYPTEDMWIGKAVTLVAIFLSIYQIIRQVTRDNK